MIFCSSCRSTRYLVHRDACTAWVIPIDFGVPVVPELALHVPHPVPVPNQKPFTLTPQPTLRRRRP